MVAIISVTPIVNTASAALNSNITLVFDTAVNPTTVNSATIKVQGNISGLISGSFSFTNNNKTVVFDPSQNFQPGEEVQVTVTNGVTDAVGGAASKYVYTFRAGVNYFSSGVFTPVTANDALFDNGTTSDDPALGDFDGDGDLDVFIANAFGQSPNGNATNQVFLNNGNGTFIAGPTLLASAAITADLLATPRITTQFLASGGATGPANTPEKFFAGTVSSEAFAADLDGDGDIDIYASNFGEDGVYLNDGTGRFTLTQLLPGRIPYPTDPSKLTTLLGGDVSSGVDLGDIDGDGDIDAVTSNFGSIQVYVNNGSGQFTNSNQLLGNVYGAGVDLGDLDGDGDLDMALGAFPSEYDPADFFFFAPAQTRADNPGYNTIWLNDGDGNFTLNQELEPVARSAVMRLGDLDGDGDLDAVSANLGPDGMTVGPSRPIPLPNQVWLNDGTGTFTKGQTIGNSITNGVELADVDGDGDLDLFEVNFGASATQGENNRIWLNDGSANFTDSGQSLGILTNISANAAFGDLNGDGALDIFVANYYSGAERVYLNSIDSSKPEAAVNTATNVVAVSKSTNLKFTLTQVNTTAVKEVGFFVVRDNNGTITDEDGNSLTPADAGYTAAAMQQATVLFAALGNNPAGFDPLGFDRIVGALGGSADVFAGGAKLVFYFVQEGSTDSLAAGNGGSVLFGTTFESNAFGASANLTITSLGNGKFSLSWLDNLTLTLESTDDDLPFGSGLQGRNECEILDLTGLTNDISVSVTVYREAAFDNLVGFYVIDDITGTVAGASVGSSDYVAKALANRITTLDLLQVGNGASASFNGVLGKGQYLAPFIIVNGTLDEALAGNADVYFPFLGSNSDGGADHVRLLANNVFGFEDLSGGGDNDFQDLIVQIEAA